MGVFDSIKKATSNIFKSPDKKKKNAGSALSSAAESAKANAALKTSSGSTGSNAALPTPSSNIKEAVGRATSTAVERTATTPGRPISTGGDSIKSNIAQAMDTAKQRTSTVSPIGRIGESNEPSIRDRFAQATDTMTSKIDLSKINSKYADNSFTNAVAAFNSDKGDEIRNREERFEPLSVTGERFGTTEQSTADQALSDRGSFSSFEEQTRPQTVSETIQNAAARMEQATGQTPSAAIRPAQGAELPSGGNGNAGTDFRVHGGSSGKFGESASSTFNTGGSVNPTLGGGGGRLEEAIKAFLNPGVIRQAGNRVVQANADGSAPKGLSIGDTVVSKNMSKTVRGVNADGSYQWFAPGEGANSLSRIDKERLPLSEQQKIDRYQRQYTQAMERGDNRTAARAHELAEKVRQQYGYSGGTFGTGYTQTGSGSYDFDEAPGRVSDASMHPERAFARAFFGTMDSQNQNEEVYALQQRNIIQKANEEMAEYNRSGKGNRKLKDVGLLDPNARASTWQSQGNAAQSTPTAGRYNGLIDDEAIRQMTPLERQTYNYLFSQHGEKRAQEYYDALAYTKLNAKAAESEAEQLQQFSREHPVLGTAVSAGLNATTGPMATAMNALQSAANASGTAPYRPVDENSALNRASMYGSQIRSNVENNIDTGNKYIDAAARFAYEGVGTGLDMAASMLTAGGFGTKAVTASMSSTSAQTTWMDSLSRGATQQQAAVNAFANGVLEFISEAPAVEGFFRIGKGTAPIKDVRTLGINLAQQMGVEAGGEGFANITQTAADQIIMGNRSSYAQTVDEYMRNGMTKEQATSQAFRDMYIVDTARAAGLGAAMGGVGGVIATGANINNTRQNMRLRAVDPDTGRTIRTYSPIAQDIAKTAQRINEDYGLPPKFVKTANAIVNGDKVGSVALANLKGAIQEQAQIQAREQIQDIYRYVGLPQESVPNRMSLALGRFTGADESGFGNRRFTQAWARKSAEIEQKLFLAYNMNPQSLADPDSTISQEMAEYMDYADMLLFSGYLSDDAETTNVVRAEVNQLTNAVEASAATMDPISADDDQVYETEESPEEQEPVIEQAEEQPVLQEEEPETVQTQEPQPTAEVEQTETVEQEPEVTPAAEQIETAPQDEVAEPVQETQEQEQEETEAPVVELQGENLSGVNTDLAGARRTPATPTGETIPTGGTTQQTATPNETIPTQGTTTTQQQTPADTTPTTDTSGGVVSGARNTVNRGVHISEVSKQNQQTRNAIDEAENYLDGNISDYDVVSVDPDRGRVTLFEVDDFDGARIPRIINQVTVDNGEVYEDNSGGRIIPNKSDYVSDDYAGFNVQEQRDYEDRWRRSGIRYDSSRINDESYFNSKFGNVLRGEEPAQTTEQTPQPVQPVQEPVTQTEEPQQEAQSNRLIRRLKVLPKGLKLNWKDAKNYQDKEYRYKNVRLVASGDTLYVRLNGTDRNNPVKQVFFEIPNYRNLTAQQIIMDLLEQADYSTSYPLGRHFDDAIKAFYKENDLHGGYTAPILRDLVTDEEVREGFKDEVLEPLSEVVEGTEKTEVDDELIEDTYQLLDDFINAYGIEDMQANTVNLMNDETMQQYVDGFEAAFVDEIDEEVCRQWDEYLSDQSFEFNPEEVTLTDKESRNVNKAHRLVKQAVPGVGEVKSSYEKLKEYITDVQKFIVYYGIEEVSNGPLTDFANEQAYDFFLNDYRTNSGALSEQEREFLQSMKDARIHFDDDIKASYGPRTIRRDGKRGAFEEWNAFKKNITGKVKLVSKKSPGRDIDVVYANLLEEYPGMFDDNVWNTEDQFHLVMDKILELNEINREGIPFTQTWEGQAFESDPEGNRFITDELSQAIREALITGKVTTNGENEETAAQQRGNEETGERVPAETSGRSSEDQGNGTVNDRRNESGRQTAEDETAPAAEVEPGRTDERESEDRSGRIAGSESNEVADAENNEVDVEQEELTPKERAQETARKASEKQRERIRREESNNELGRTDRELSEGAETAGLPEDEEGWNAGRSAERNRTDSDETGSEYSTRDNRGDSELERVSVDSGNGSSESGRTDRNGEDAGTRDSEGYDSRVANARRFYIGRGRIDPATLPPAQRARNNIDAIRLYKEITEQGRQATLEEKEILASYSGWGGLTQMFVGKNQLKGEFKEMQQELKELLPKKEWDSARKSITSAYFTPYEVIENIYSVVNQLGITKSAQILEPSCGSGFFLGCMPKTLRENSAITGIELDTITGGMARLIYDDVDVRVQGFQDYKNGSPSLIIGNVPFGNIKVYDGKYKQESKHNIHDYFITKGLSMLQDGGIMAVLTTSGTMDKVSKTARSQMAAKANLIGAVRLPAGTFGATNVVTDLLIFQKKGENVNDEYGQDFLETYEDENGLTINTYFRDHPEMVLGTIESTSNQFGGTSLTVRPDGRTIADILPAIPAGIVSESAQRKAVELDKKTEKKIAPTIQKRSVIDTNERQPIGTINKVDGELYTADGDGGWVPYDPDVKAAKKKADLKERAKAMFDLLQARQDLLDLERSTEDDDVVQEAIREFERKYDGFVEKYGYIHNRNNKKAYESDSGNYSKLASMENGKQNKKGNIFFERVISPKQEITHVNSAVDALTVSLNMTGGVDLEYMSQLYGKPAEEIVKELSGRIYTDPISGQYVTTDELASGNVREKYETLTRKEDKSEEDFDAMAKLAEVMPKDLTPEEISVSLGSPWVGEEYTSEFIHDICGGSLGAYYQPASGTWYMTGWADYRKNDKYGVGKVKTDDLIEKILNKRDLVIKDADGHIDREKTNQLEVRADELRNQFELWVWKDEQRRADLLDKYNRLYNSNVNREYDGSYLELPGHNPAITLRTHQSNAVARGTQTRNSLFVHPVGSGKTFAMIATIMEMKRLGIAQKPLLVVPNAKVAEFMEDAYKLYPAAEILAIQDNDFSKQNRQEMLAKIEAGTYDMIIMRASNFDMFPLSKEYMEQYMDSELSKYRMALAESKGGEANLSSKDTNNLERSIASVEKALQEYMAKITDSSEQINIFLDQCGIDALVVDEVQNYKNLYFPTRFARVKGVTSGKPSQKCIHMHMVTQMLNQRKNHIIFASATPVTNSLSELYNMQRYLQPEVLAEYGLDSFDAWASTFSELVSAPELNSTGTKAKIVTRFSKFKNLPELGNMIMRTFDMVAKEDLQLKLPEVRRHHVTSPSGRLLDALNAAIDARMIYDPESDSIALEAFNDAKFAATDLRFVHGILVEHGFIPPNTPIEELDLPNSKVNKCVANVLEKYEETSDNDGTQVIFLDKGIPGSGKDKGKAKKYGFDLYSDIKAKLVAGGIPESEIAFIHDYNTDKKKGELSAAMNSGEIRVLIGSTEKAGVGLNIQEKLAAAHHLDAPMRPADYEQRNGRIIRQGNTNEVVDIYNYSTLNSFDAPMWQMLERKQSGINSVMSGKITSREIEDSADLSDIFTTMTIEAANNDLLFELQEVQETVRKLSSKQALFEQDKFAYQDLIANGTAAEQKILANIREAESRRDYIKENESAGFVVRGKTYDSMKEASEAAYQAFNSRSMREKYDPFVIGQINGVNIVAQAQSNLEYRGLFVVRLEGIPWTNLFYVAYRGQEEKAQATSELSFGRVDSIFQMARNRIEESKANSYIEQEQRRLEHLRERISEANEHINDTFDQEEELRQARIREKEINDEMLNAETGRAKPEIRMYYPEEFALETEAPAPVEETAPAEEQTAPAEEAVEEEPAINPETGEIIEEEPATTGEMPERLESRSGSNPQASPAVKATVRRVRQESRENQPIQVDKGTNSLPKEYLEGAQSYQRARDDYGKAKEAQRSVTKQDVKATKKTGLQGIINEIMHTFDIRFTTAGRMRGRTMGYYDTQHQVIHTKFHNALGVGIHELGHHLDNLYKFSDNPAIANILKNAPGLESALDRAGYRDKAKPFETAAEFLWQYMTNPDGAYEMGSYSGTGENFYDTFESKLSKADLQRVQHIRARVFAFYGDDVSAAERMQTTTQTRKEARQKMYKGRMIEYLHDVRTEVLTSVVDYTTPFRDLMNEIEDINGEPLSEMDRLDVSLAMAGSCGTQADALIRAGGAFMNPDNTVNENFSSFGDIFASMEKEMSAIDPQWVRDFESYLKSKHSIDWENNGKQTVSRDLAHHISGSPVEDTIRFHHEVIDELDQKYGRMFAEHADMLYKWWDQFMQTWAVDSGLVDADLYEHCKELNPHYIPMTRVMDDGRMSAPGYKGDILKRAYGSSRNTYSPIESMIGMISNIVRARYENEFGKNIARLYDRQDEDIQAFMGLYVDELPSKLVASRVDMRDLKDQLAAELMIHTEENLSDDLKASLDKMDPFKKLANLADMAGVNLIDAVIDDTVMQFRPTWKGIDKDAILVKYGGKTRAFKFEDKNLQQALKALEPSAKAKAIKTVGKVTRVFSALTTASNPIFAVSNAIRDFQHGFVTDGSALYAIRWGAAVGQSFVNEFRKWRGAEQNEDYLRARAALGFGSKLYAGQGAFESYMESIGVGKRGNNPVSTAGKAGIRGLKKAFGLVEVLNGSIEMGPRLAAYNRAYKNTDPSLSEEDRFRIAAKAAREVTVDFNRRGTSTRNLASLVPFFGAGMAGIKQAQEIVASKEAWTTKKGRKRLLRALISQAIPALILAIMYGGDDDDSEEYQALNDYTRNAYWCFKIGDTWIRIPKDRELSALFGTSFQDMALAYLSDEFRDPETATDYLGYLIQQFMPPHELIGTALIDAWANRTWYGGTLVSESAKGNQFCPDYYQNVTDDDTSRIANGIAHAISKLPDDTQEFLGVLATPKGIDYVMDQMGGGLADVVLPLFTPAKGAAGVAAMLAGRLSVNENKTNKYINDAYEIKEKLDAEVEFRGEDVDPNVAAWADVFNATMATTRKENSDYKTIGDYYKEIRELSVDESLSYKERQKQINERYGKIADIATELVKAYEAGGSPKQTTYAEVQVPEDAKQAGFTEKDYIQSVESVQATLNSMPRKTNLAKQLAIASSNLTEKQKEYMSQKLLEKSYSEYGADMQELLDKGLSINTLADFDAKVKEKGYGDQTRAQSMVILNSNYTDEEKDVLLRMINTSKNRDVYIAAYKEAAAHGVTDEDWMKVKNGIESRYGSHPNKSEIVQAVRAMGYTGEMQKIMCKMYRTNWFLS